MSKKNLTVATKEKNDEFYTQLSDIERELRHYKKYFKDKTIYCNCDDPEWSNFYIYFSNAFEHLKLKKLITTHYSEENLSYKLEIMRTEEGIVENKIMLEENGDFRSKECIELLKESDIVVTNPPFSLFREYIAQLMTYDKFFIIIGNTNAISYKDTFKLIKDNKIWLGISPRSMNFILPNKSLKAVNASWFTNLAHSKRNEEIELFKEYKDNENMYPKYDNYDAIEVSKTSNIPVNYDGVMGVPITFLEKYNPEQFEILGMAASAGYSKDVVGIPFLGEKDARPLLNTKNTYARVFIKNKKLKGE